MKVKIGTRAALISGLCALLTRLLQYVFGLDAEGFSKTDPLSKGLMLALILLLLGGIAFAWIGAFEKNVPPAEYDTLFKQVPIIRFFFILLAVMAAAQGVLQLLDRAAGRPVAAVFFFAGALGWLMASRNGAKAGLFSLLPLLQLGATVIFCFWDTYKFIHISADNLALLGYCAELAAAVMLMKVYSGQQVSQKKLARTLSYALVLLPAAFFAPLAAFRLTLVLPAAQALLLWLIALIAAIRLPVFVPETPVVAPDLEELDLMIDDLPEPEDPEQTSDAMPEPDETEEPENPEETEKTEKPDTLQ